MTEEERLQLLDFLQSLERLLEFVALGRRDLLPEYMHPTLEGAWAEVQPKFGVVAEGIQSRNSDHEMENAGLAGASLSMKMTGFRRSLAGFLGNQIPRLLVNVLKWANIALGSLAQIFNAAEPIKEFKEAIEAGAVERQG